MPNQGLQASSARPTIRDVSRLAGVSTATVSRVLSGLGGASEATAKRIEKAVAQLGYQRNRMASGLRSTHSTLVGMVIPDLQNPFFTGVVAGVEEALRQAGYTLFLANSDDDPGRERRELRALRSERACGVALIPCATEASDYEELVKSGLPLVAIDRVPDDLVIDSVRSANEAGAFRAVSRLLDAGYGEVGLINGPEAIGVARERGAGYFRAMETFGVKVDERWVATGDFRSDSGYQATLAVMNQVGRPRALFVSNFLMALGALRAIHELGLRIPDDVALFTFDDMPWAEAMNPPVSVVAQPVRELGRCAAELLLERLAEPEKPKRHIVLDTNLVVRESCGTRGTEGKR